MLPDARHAAAPYRMSFGDARCVWAVCGCELRGCGRWVVVRFAGLDQTPHPRMARWTLREWLSRPELR